MLFRHCSSIVLICWVILSACTPNQEIIDDNPGQLVTFSTDTLIFDTLFTSLGSTTRRVRIRNNNKNAVRLGNIRLAGGASSPYSLIVGGDEGVFFDDVVIFGKDSLLLLVEVTIDPRNEDIPFLVKDSIIVSQGNVSQDIKLISWGHDAVFLNNVVLNCNETWTAERPYVIVNGVLVDTLCNLTIEKGAKVFFDNDASLFVRGKIDARGDTSKLITFSSVRRDGIFESTPGQWGGIFILEGSEGNIFDHTRISNGEVGLRVGAPDDNDLPDVTITNSIIENMSEAGILAFTSDLVAINTLIINCNNYLVGNFAGGNYQYHHCTFTNEPNDFRRDEPSVQFSDNIILADNSLLTGDLTVELVNSIIWGTLEDELFFSLDGQAEITLTIQNNVMRTTIEDFNVNDNIIGQELNFPGFVSPFQRDYRIDSMSVARNAGISIGVQSDLRGLPRDTEPDIGAYERIDDN